MSQVLPSGKTGANKYDLRTNDPNKVLPRLDVRQIAQNNQRAYQQTQGYSLSGNEGAASAIDGSLSIIDDTTIGNYDDSMAKMIQTYVANASRLIVDGGSTANSLILNPPVISPGNSPNGTDYSEATSLPFAYKEGLRFTFLATLSNTGAVQVQIPGLSGLVGSVDLVDQDGNDLVANDIVVNKYYTIIAKNISGDKFILLNPEIIDNLKSNDLTINNKLNTQSNSATISAGAITYTSSYTYLIGEGSADDNLDTINGGTAGDRILLKPQTGTITIRDNDLSGGNITLIRNSTRTLQFTVDTVELIYDGGFWLEVASNSDIDFRLSPNTNGYTYLPNGIILQWGVAVNVGGSSTQGVTLPITYPNAIWMTQTTAGTTADINEPVYSYSQTTSYINVFNSSSTTVNIYWFTIGN
jgi:hypothetical protein